MQISRGDFASIIRPPTRRINLSFRYTDTQFFNYAYVGVRSRIRLHSFLSPSTFGYIKIRFTDSHGFYNSRVISPLIRKNLRKDKDKERWIRFDRIRGKRDASRNRWRKIKKSGRGRGKGSGEKEALRKCGGALARKRARARGKLRDPLAQIAKAATPSTILLTTNYVS